MTVERETAGFALPFAAGTAAAIYAGASSGSIFISLSVILVLVSSLCLLMSESRRSLSEKGLRSIMTLTALATGAFCGITSNETAVSSYSLPDLFAKVGSVLENAADSLKFNDKQTNALIKAILTGERNGMSPEITEAFRASGASHILALSGLHLGVIYLMICRMLAFIGFGPAASAVRSVLTVILCGIYTLATGAGPSLVRALLFIILNEAARMTGRYRSTGNVLLTALVIQLCLSPASVRSVGFQLSYAAMAGIAFIYPWLKGFWPADEALSPAGRLFGKGMRRIWDSLALSISCQITTGPLAYMYFGTFPMHFLLTNLLTLPLTGILIPAALLTMVLCGLGCCPAMLVSATEFLAQALIQSLHVIATM